MKTQTTTQITEVQESMINHLYMTKYRQIKADGFVICLPDSHDPELFISLEMQGPNCDSYQAFLAECLVIVKS